MRYSLIIRLFFVAVLFGAQPSPAASSLMVYSGAGLMKPMEELRTGFERQNNVKVNVHYGGSGEIFGMLAMGQCCDVFIPGAEKYIRDAEKKGWLKPGSEHKIVRHIPVVVVPKGNPGKITKLSDLSRKGVRVTLGDPKACAIGKISKKLLQKNHLYKNVKANVVVSGPTVNQLLIYVAMNRVDAAIIWEDVVAWAAGCGKVEVIQIPESKNTIKTVPCSVTNCSKNPMLAEKFNNYISSDRSVKIWEKWGFKKCIK